ncbi:MAG: Gfo/Idh/MocA family oxidoreductase [Clostridia bacterium]|nr:Gfo/Idh/MocA family oxidoreductase [Clostridia bacterium]
MKSNDNLRVGIVGYGVVGKRRRHYIDQHPNMKTVAVCDQNFSEPCVMADGIRCYNDYNEILKEDLDAVFVSLPNYLAAEVTIAGLERGMHIFCEKPPGRDVADIEKVVEAEKKNKGLVLKYGFNHRYHESVKEAIRIIKSGELGEIVSLRGVYGKSKIIPFSGGWRAERKYSGGGILLDQGIHMVDLMRLFCGEFVEVKSYISNSYWKHDVEDNAYALMRDRLGRIAMLHSTATQWQHKFSLEISLTEGFIELRGILSGSKSYGQEMLILGKRDESDVGATREQVTTYLEDNSWRDEVNEFADAILKGIELKSGNSADALDTMKLIYEIYGADSEWCSRFNIK